MRVIKSDGRRKFFRAGFKTILEFDTDNKDKILRNQIVTHLRQKYGPTDRYPSNSWGVLRNVNENWRAQLFNGNSRKSRIYLREESEVTMILLQLELKR
jgi:hypothetical protein